MTTTDVSHAQRKKLAKILAKNLETCFFQDGLTLAQMLPLSDNNPFAGLASVASPLKI